jgi:sulfur dioxygenase
MSMIFRQLFDYETWTYTYLLADPVSKEALLIDTVKEQVERDLALLSELELKLKYVLETHIHADHVTGAATLRTRTGAKVGVNAAAGVTCCDLQLKDGDELALGSFRVKCITTPGHTNTCMSFYCDGRVFTGDTLFIRDAGRTDFQQGSPEKMYDSVTRKLFSLPDSTMVYPGHDYKGQTSSTVAEEKKFNMKLGGGKTLAEFRELMAAMKLGQPKRIHIAVPANMVCGAEVPQAGV